MLSDVQVTLGGYVGTDVDYRESGGAARATFRVASTPRFLDRQQGVWRDQQTVWVTVKAWRSLATNVCSSIRKGEPVIVVGKLRDDSWTNDRGETHSRLVVEAISIGHDLTRGTSAYLRRATPPTGRTDEASEGTAVRAAATA